MRIRTRVEALERKASPTGECGCPENRKMDLVLVRDPSVPRPPPRICGRCGRPVRRVFLGPTTEPGAPYEPVASLRDYLVRTALPAYEPADNATILAMMAPPAYEPADADTVRRMAGLGPPMPAR